MLLEDLSKQLCREPRWTLGEARWRSEIASQTESRAVDVMMASVTVVLGAMVADGGRGYPPTPLGRVPCGRSLRVPGMGISVLHGWHPHIRAVTCTGDMQTRKRRGVRLDSQRLLRPPPPSHHVEPSLAHSSGSWAASVHVGVGAGIAWKRRRRAHAVRCRHVPPL